MRIADARRCRWFPSRGSDRATRPAAGINVPRLRGACLDRLIGRVIPTRRVTRVAVSEDAIDNRGVAPVADVAKEPEPVAQHRPTDAAAPVPVLAERGRLRNSIAA